MWWITKERLWEKFKPCLLSPDPPTEMAGPPGIYTIQSFHGHQPEVLTCYLPVLLWLPPYPSTAIRKEQQIPDLIRQVNVFPNLQCLLISCLGPMYLYFPFFGHMPLGHASMGFVHCCTRCTKSKIFYCTQGQRQLTSLSIRAIARTSEIPRSWAQIPPMERTKTFLTRQPIFWVFKITRFYILSTN